METRKILENQGYPSEKWFTTHGPIEEFVDPTRELTFQEDIHNISNTNPGTLGSGEHLRLERLLGVEGKYNPKNTLLDVGGGTGAEVCSLLKQGPFVYIIDPTVGMFKPIHPHRVIKGRAENMPFFDQSFRWVISIRSVGWYPQIINPFLTLYEMIRVAKERVNITVGQDKCNLRILRDALDDIKKTPLGERIRSESIRSTEIALLLNSQS